VKKYFNRRAKVVEGEKAIEGAKAIEGKIVI
jgi:hypothetical protein